MKYFKQSAREISYAYSAQTFRGRAFIKILENIYKMKVKKFINFSTVWEDSDKTNSFINLYMTKAFTSLFIFQCSEFFDYP